MISAFMPVADGEEGVRQIVRVLNGLKSSYGQMPAIRAAALRIAVGRKNHDQAGQVNRIARFVRRALVYVADPVNAEYIQTPDILLLEIHRTGRAQGDCDDHCLLFATLCEALGIPTDIVGVVSIGGTTFDHVVCVAHLDNGSLTFDLCAKGAEQPAYTEFLTP